MIWKEYPLPLFYNPNLHPYPNSILSQKTAILLCIKPLHVKFWAILGTDYMFKMHAYIIGKQIFY